jgi:hypothetical protein
VPTVDQYLRAVARSQPDMPFWMVTFASVADFLAPELQAVARVEWERQLLPFVPDAPSVEHVLAELVGLLAALP